MRSLRVSVDDRPTICAPAPQRSTRVTRKRASQPRRTQANDRMRLIRGGIAALGVAVLAAGGWWSWQAGVFSVVADTTHAVTSAGMVRAGLTVQDVELTGREHTPADAVLAASGLHRGDPILFVNLDDVRARIQGLGWIESASVVRRLPDTIAISIVERAPFARWQLNGRTVLIDRTGAVLERDDPDDYRDLKRVVGEGAAKHAAALFGLLATEPALAARVTDAVRVRNRRWDLELDNGLTVRLPEDGMDTAWARLAALEREQKLLGRDIATIDFRLSDRTIVRLTPEAMAARKTPGKNT